MDSMRERIAEASQEWRKQYYRSWTSYAIPMNPVDPISFVDTEGLTSFYLGIHDQEGRLRLFAKYIVVEADVGQFRPLRGCIGGAQLYFPDTRSILKDGLVENDGILYSSTEGMSSYLRGQVDQKGEKMNLFRAERDILFLDEYAYWPNGNLRERIIAKKSGEVLRSICDESGQRIP